MYAPSASVSTTERSPKYMSVTVPFSTFVTRACDQCVSSTTLGFVESAKQPKHVTIIERKVESITRPMYLRRRSP